MTQTHEEFKESISALLDGDISQIQEQGEMTLEAMALPKKKSKRKKPSLRLWDPSLVKSEYDNEEHNSRRESFLSPMQSEKHRKVLVAANRKTFRSLKALSRKFPNFSEVIERYEDSLKLRALGKTSAVWLPPILLVGPPGIGKTRFLTELAKALGIEFFSVDLSTASAGFILTGGSSQWSNGRPGFVSTSLRKSRIANPLLLVDEIDKAGGDNRYDPISCFYSLLEKKTAKVFKDECLDIPMDCSAVNWVASANYIDQIPEPIRSRMEVFEISAPTAEQMPAIIQSLFTELVESDDWGKRFITNLSEEMLGEMTVCTPREMGKVLEKSCANAAKRKGKAKGKIRLLVKDIQVPKVTTAPRNGF